MKRLFALCLFVSGCCIFSPALLAASKEKVAEPTIPSVSSRGAYMAELTLSSKTKPLVRKNMQKRLLQLQELFPGCVVAMRDSVVACVIFPASEVFCSNDTVLSDGGMEWLKRGIKLFPDADNFHIVVSVHTANTGTSTNIARFSQQRAEAVAEALNQNVKTTTVIVPFGMGDAEPIARNNTYQGREKNRRVEIWFIPTTSWAERLASRR